MDTSSLVLATLGIASLGRSRPLDPQGTPRFLVEDLRKENDSYGKIF